MGTIRLEKLDWDEECERDFITGKGFEVKEKAFGPKEEKAMNGSHSPKFATDYEDDDAFAERYRCKCGEMKGRVYEGELCPACGTKVKFRDIDLKITGWIILKNQKIIQPIFYNIFESIVGPSDFQEIIGIDKEITRDGNIKYKKSKNNPFRGIGIVEFRERVDEVLDYYYHKKKKKRELIDSTREELKKAFASCIPVFSSVLRPTLFKGESMLFDDIDKKYNTILADVKVLNERTEGIIINPNTKRARLDDPTLVFNIQKNLMKLWELVFSKNDTKYGHIRRQILGGRINFSSRNVIIPDPTLKADEVKLGYQAFLELYKYEIIAHISKMDACTHNQAYNEWCQATISFSAKVYGIMSYIIKKRKPHIIINRNPTINYGSLLLMKVVEVKNHYEEDYTMSLPIMVLTVLNADQQFKVWVTSDSN